MDDNNNFLNSYRKKMEGAEPEKPASAPEPAAEPALTRSGFRPPERRMLYTPPSRRSNGWIAPTVVGVVLLALAAVGLFYFLNRGTPMEDFTGWAIDDAQLWADDHKASLQIEQVYDDKVDAGRVMSQSPDAGARVKKGDFLKVTVSQGHDLTVALDLPDLMTMTKEQVESWAAENYMAKVRITAENSDEVPAGKVISCTINDNTVVDQVTRNTPIYVVVSKGPVDEAALLITVPNFKEMPLADCYAFASENGLTLTVDEQYDDYAPEGTILSQSIKADEKVKKGDEIKLLVSKGKEITVPDFKGYSKEKAMSVATAQGITASVSEKYSGSAAGKFLSQSIKAGTVYGKGDVLELSYSLGNEVIVADYVGQTKDIILAWAKDLNNQGASIKISVTYTQSGEAKGKILSQDKANSMISVKSTIHITVSKGKAAIMPDFVAPSGSGYDAAITRDRAMELCQALKIVPVFVEAKKSGRLPGEVWSQSIAAGTEVEEGTTVTLKYVPASAKITVPDLTGKTEAQIRDGAYFSQFAITFVVGDSYVDGSVGRVYDQSLTPGSQSAVGAALTVTLGPEGPAPDPTSSDTP